MPRLRHVDTAFPGLGRRRRGRSFAYVDERGRPIGDTAVLERIRALAIPPAWADVWICPYPNGHIQAAAPTRPAGASTSTTRRGATRRDREKFDRMLDFAARLPGLRARASSDLALEGLPRERVLACAVRLLDLGFFRIGSEEYAEENETFGLATMRQAPREARPASADFDYVAKGGKRRVQSIVDPVVYAWSCALKRAAPRR